MYKIQIDKGTIALRDNSMIFGKTVFLSEEDEAYKYHIIDKKTHEEITPCSDMPKLVQKEEEMQP